MEATAFQGVWGGMKGGLPLEFLKINLPLGMILKTVLRRYIAIFYIQIVDYNKVCTQ